MPCETEHCLGRLRTLAWWRSQHFRTQPVELGKLRRSEELKSDVTDRVLAKLRPDAGGLQGRPGRGLPPGPMERK